MDNHAVATGFGILGAVLWSLQLIPHIWKNFRRHSTESLSATFFLLWAIAGIPVGVYNIVDILNTALQIQSNILILLSLVTWSKWRHYGDRWSWTKTSVISMVLALVFGGIETGLVFALRLGRDRGYTWPSAMMAILSALLLAGGALRHYVDMIKTRPDAGMSLKFALLDASGDLASLISVTFQPHLEVLGLVIYGSDLAMCIGLIGLVCYFRVLHRRHHTKPAVDEITLEVESDLTRAFKILFVWLLRRVWI